MTATPKLAPRVVVDCSDPDTTHLEDALADLNKLARSGDVAAVRDTLDQIENLLGDKPDRVQYVELTADELAQRALDEKAALERTKEQKRSHVRTALAATDHWVARAHEDGKPVAKPKAAHRAKLRALFPAIDAAGNLADLDAIEIPEPPA